MHKLKMFRAWTFQGYDRDFKLFVLVTAGMLAQQTVLLTLTKEMTDAIPYISEVRQIGDIAATGRIAMAIAALCWAFLGERYLRKRLLILGGTMSTIPFLYAIVAPSYPVMFCSLVASFVGMGVYLALSPTIVMDMIPPGKRGQALSLLGLATLGGQAVGTILPSFLIEHVPWQVPMLIVGLFSLTGLISSLFIKIPRRGAQELGPAESGDQRTAPEAAELGALKRVFRIRSNVSIFLFFAALQLSWGGIGYYVFTIFKQEYGLSAPLTMLVVMGSQSLAMIGTGFWGPRSDDALKKGPDGRIQTLMVAGLTETVFTFLAYLVLPAYRLNPWFLAGYMAFSLIASFASGQALTPLMDSIVGDTGPPELRAITTSTRNLVGLTASGVGTLFIGAMHSAQGTFTWATLLMSVLGLSSVLFLLPARQAVPEDMQALENLLEDRAQQRVVPEGIPYQEPSTA